MRVFIAGKMYVGVVGARARSREVCASREPPVKVRKKVDKGMCTYDEVIAQPCCNLGKGVC
jgi:hypothetical protein